MTLVFPPIRFFRNVPGGMNDLRHSASRLDRYLSGLLYFGFWHDQFKYPILDRGLNPFLVYILETVKTL
jgi:hypothetical protein